MTARTPNSACAPSANQQDTNAVDGVEDTAVLDIRTIKADITGIIWSERPSFLRAPEPGQRGVSNTPNGSRHRGR